MVKQSEHVSICFAPRAELTISTHSEQETVIDRLERARHGLSFRDLARLTGCNAESVRRYHRVGSPSYEYIVSFCRALRISPNWLLFGEGAPERDNPVNRLLKDASISELFDALSKVYERAENADIGEVPRRPELAMISRMRASG